MFVCRLEPQVLLGMLIRSIPHTRVSVYTRTHPTKFTMISQLSITSDNEWLFEAQTIRPKIVNVVAMQNKSSSYPRTLVTIDKLSYCLLLFSRSK